METLQTVEADAWLRSIARMIELAAVVVLLIGGLAASVAFISDLVKRVGFEPAFHRYRVGLARSLLLTVELLVAADLIGTVVIEPTMDNIAVLGLIVLIRTFLSFSLEIEIEGRFPWRRHVPGKPPAVKG